MTTGITNGITTGAIELQKKHIPCEIWMRVVGYYRPKNQCNPGKQAELTERKMINIDCVKGGGK